MDSLQQFIMVIISLGIGLFVGKYLQSYYTEKGRNKARHEDEGSITSIIEGIKKDIIADLDALKRYEDLKAKSYVDFCESIAAISIAQKFKNTDKELDAAIRLADARARISIYGSREVATKIGNFLMSYGNTFSPEARASLVDAIYVMRSQVIGEIEPQFANTISQLLFSEGL